MADRRMETRKKLMAFTTARDQRQGTLLGYLGNLTLHGLLVIGEKPLEINEHILLEVEFPEELSHASARRLVLEARVARCVPDPESPHEFNIGFEFLNIQPEQIQIIEALLERYHFRYQD